MKNSIENRSKMKCLYSVRVRRVSAYWRLKKRCISLHSFYVAGSDVTYLMVGQIFDCPPINMDNFISFLYLWHAHISLKIGKKIGLINLQRGAHQ